MKYREFIRLIEQDGWIWARTTGSHKHYHHPDKPGVVTLAGIGNVDIPKGTLKLCSNRRG